ncbi:MAG TPA: homoserine kinase [Candidatus Stackebrandtia excrementipullorum]|nr:homoserine kinase [Candidatus Stackebrandtia excrementipullorum]
MTGFSAEPMTVRVPATSANLGAGFDSLGLALSLYDEVTAHVTTEPTVVTVEGEGAGVLPGDDSHLVASAFRVACEVFGSRAPNVAIHCRNTIPQARGLGSSSAAIVAGMSLAAGLVLDHTMDEAELLRVAAEMEGHPDNVAPCLLGGFTIAWTERNGAKAVRLEPAADLPLTVYVPNGSGLTSHARAALPGRVPHVDAAFNISRAALAVHAVTVDPSLLVAATEDRLHQRYRRDVMPRTIRLVDRLRESGVPAVVSGAGPSVLAFDQEIKFFEGFDCHRVKVGTGISRL